MLLQESHTLVVQGHPSIAPRSGAQVAILCPALSAHGSPPGARKRWTQMECLFWTGAQTNIYARSHVLALEAHLERSLERRRQLAGADQRARQARITWYQQQRAAPRLLFKHPHNRAAPPGGLQYGDDPPGRAQLRPLAQPEQAARPATQGMPACWTQPLYVEEARSASQAGNA